MFLGSYHFDGDPVALAAAYDRLMQMMPPEQIDLHVCVTRDDGITIYDACPDRDTFAAFSTSADLAGAFAAAGLPSPRVERLGEVHLAKLRQPVAP
jgi:hypothetical protein